MSQRFEVARSDGSTVCEIEAMLDGPCLQLTQQISDYLGICKCKIRLCAGDHQVRDGLCVKRIMKFIEPASVPQLIVSVQPVSLTSAADLHASGVCFKCMREVGVQANAILELQGPVDAAALRRAGFSLEDLRFARDQPNQVFKIHPPVTNHPLFDSKLKAAGFSAGDFKRAGYSAEDLSENFFWRDPDIYPGDAEWAECMAFFTASELRSAGYTGFELLRACFRTQDLKEAGFGSLEVTWAEEELRSWNGRHRRPKLRKLK